MDNDVEKTIEEWGIEVEDIGSMDFGFDSLEDPYSEISYFEDIEGLDLESVSAAETVMAFHIYANAAIEGSDPNAVEKISEAVRSIKRFHERGTVSSDLDFLYDKDYSDEISNKLEHRNMAKRIAEVEVGEDESVKKKDDFIELEREFVSYLLGEEYQS